MRVTAARLGIFCLIAVLVSIYVKPACGPEELVQVAPTRAELSSARSKQPLLGYMLRPKSADPQAAIVILHGCEGFGLTYIIRGREFQTAAYVVLVLDRLGSANACNCGAGAPAEALDAYAAIGWLDKHSFVDPTRVAVLGFSTDGLAALMVAQRGPLESTVHFRAAVAYYPACPWSSGIMTLHTLILIGGGDERTPAADCEVMIKGQNETGVQIALRAAATRAFH
ncbi:dienelactone hydrolase family protein [Rhodopila sp.]|uniref:dienelactone hydrolase family protein n=1 Tax=Rhodopila sp. TaxID=2480087 RepID=UPI003D0FA4EC